MSSLLLPPLYQARDSSGHLAKGALLYVYDAGTTTLASTYSDLAATIASTVDSNGAIVADAAGHFPNIYVNGGQNYKLILQTSAGVEILNRDELPPAISNGSGLVPVANGGTAANSPSSARTSLGAASSSDVSSLSTDVANVKGQIDALPGGALGDIAAVDKAGFSNLTGLSPIIKRSVSTAQPSASMANSDGTEYATVNFTPTRSTSQVVVIATGILSTGSTGVDVTHGLFRNGTSSAIRAALSRPNGTGGFALIASVTTGSTDQITFALRSTSTAQDITFDVQEYEAAT